MNYAKALYHRVVPARIRNPIGLFRRSLADRIERLLTRVPPRELLAKIQMTPWAREYLGVGRRSARSILRQLELSLVPTSVPAKILDFGCGSGRILRYFRGTAWQLHGCDIDRGAIEWSRKALPFAECTVCPADPPLPYSHASFDVVLSVSVFSHFSPEEQRTWSEEIARLLRPGGLLLLSTMGPSVLDNFPQFATETNRTRLTTEGSLFFLQSGGFNASAAFHTPGAIVQIFSPYFFLLRWLERGLDGFQDLSVLQKAAG